MYEGKLIGETSYPRRAAKYTELELGVTKIDFYDPKERVVHEVKKSNKMEAAHEWQVTNYLYLMEQAGIEGATGLLEYPEMRETQEVFLTGPDRAYLEEILPKIEELIKCPSSWIKSRYAAIAATLTFAGAGKNLHKRQLYPAHLCGKCGRTQHLPIS